MQNFRLIYLILGLATGLLYGTNNQLGKAQTPASSKFKLLTTLYNEKHKNRCLEFITCLENNLKNTSLDTIHVIYDTAKDDSNGSILLDYLKSKKIKISYISGRTSYEDFFKIANKEYPNCRIIVSNADIFFNETLSLLETCDLSNKFLALTRWNVTANETLVEPSRNGGSQDVWIFQTPLPKFKNNTIQIGLLGCDNAIAYQAKEAGLELFNPSLSIICCHLHLSNIKNYPKGWPYRGKIGEIGAIPKCTIDRIYSCTHN